MAESGVFFRPVFEGLKPSEPGDNESRDDAAAIKTYRYLRLAMIVIVSAMLASIIFTWRTAGCFQGSISAYYYTPTGPIFIAGLVGIGVALVVIKGSTLIEDVLLMLAGALAPIVAFVPTSVEAACSPKQPLERPAAPSIDAQLNNLKSLLVAGVVALVLGAIVLVAEKGLTKSDTRNRVLLLVAMAVVLAAAALLVSKEMMLRYHGQAAVAMFAILALASIYNGMHVIHLHERSSVETPNNWLRYAVLYIAVGIAMLVAGIVQLAYPGDGWHHKTLVIEIIEITLFAGMWSIQSFERWGKVLQEPVVKPAPAPLV